MAILRASTQNQTTASRQRAANRASRRAAAARRRAARSPLAYPPEIRNLIYAFVHTDHTLLTNRRGVAARQTLNLQASSRPLMLVCRQLAWETRSIQFVEEELRISRQDLQMRGSRWPEDVRRRITSLNIDCSRNSASSAQLGWLLAQVNQFPRVKKITLTEVDRLHASAVATHTAHLWPHIAWDVQEAQVIVID